MRNVTKLLDVKLNFPNGIEINDFVLDCISDAFRYELKRRSFCIISDFWGKDKDSGYFCFLYGEKGINVSCEIDHPYEYNLGNIKSIIERIPFGESLGCLSANVEVRYRKEHLERKCSLPTNPTKPYKKSSHLRLAYSKT